MNATTLISSIRQHDQLKDIAKSNNMTLGSLKDLLITLIDQSKDLDCFRDSNIKLDEEDESKNVIPINSGVEECDIDEYSTDDEFEDPYDRIIRESPIQFSDEQLEFMHRCVKQKQSLMLAAPAGYGKSAVIETCVTLMQELFKPHPLSWFNDRYGKHFNNHQLVQCSPVGLCASTGKAASLIKGRTFHSYFGIGFGRGNVDEWVKRLKTARYLKPTYDNLKAVQVVIIDEVSMISAAMFDKISEYLKKIRKCDKPFGGIQMVCIGDMAQIGPVDGSFLFQSSEYKAANIETFRLTKCFRQQSDLAFLQVLNELRYGNCSDESFEILKAQTSIDDELSMNGTLTPMKILSTNAEVDKVNEEELAKACEKSKTDPISFPVKIDRGFVKKAEAVMKMESIPTEVKLVVGAQIVVTHNINASVVNGTQGKVVALKPNEVIVDLVEVGQITIGYVECKDPDHPCIFTASKIFSYLPIKLGYASTIHKVQGMTISALEIDCKRIFCHGQLYCGVSRVRSLKGLCIKNLTKKAIICHRSVIEFMKME